MGSEVNLVAAAEALIFASPDPVSLEDLGRALGVKVDEAARLVAEVRSRYGGESGIQLVELAGGYQFVTRPEYAGYLARLKKQPRSSSLSRAALQTLAVIAYKQPITRAEIEQIRGVNVEGVLASLLDRGLIREVGHKNSPGKPILYGTSGEFLRYFGLKSLEELPPLDEFLRKGEAS